MQSNHTKIGFVGLGLMGGWMTRHLLKSGFEVYAYDLDTSKQIAMEEFGAVSASNLMDLLASVDVIVLSLPNSKIVHQVLIEDLNLLTQAKKNLIIIDTSTSDPDDSKEISQQLAKKEMYFLDAAVSGTSEMCAAKDTLFMVGGEESIYNSCQEIFLGMGRESVYMGPSGSGAVMKLVVNLVLAINRMGLAEGLTLAHVAGIDQLTALEVLKKSAAFSKAMDQKGYRMVHRQFYPPIGHMTTHYKDVQLMVSFAGRICSPVPVISLAAQALASQIAKGHGARDSSAMIGFYDDLIANPPKTPKPPKDAKS